MARVGACISCKKVKTIRRKSGKCDSCYHREDFRTKPGVARKVKARSKAWRLLHADEVDAYNRRYYRSNIQKKGTNGKRH